MTQTKLFKRYFSFFLPALLLCVITIGSCTATASSIANVNQTIHILTNGQNLKPAVSNDVIGQLNNIKGVKAMISNSRNADYLIVLTSGKSLPLDGQSFSVSTDKNTVTIEGQEPYGFINGLYYFLEQLGFRWYMPGDAWTITPSRINWQSINKKVVTPDFRDRNYFGTGGWGGKKAYDPNDEVKKAFSIWDQRNRIFATYTNHGHTGVAFYNQNKAYLSKHPEFFCDGKPGPNSLIKLGSKAIVDYIVKQKTANINWNTYSTIGMDPHDGSGGKNDCLTSPTGTFKSYSDKYFWLANQVAAAIPKNASTLVDMYAYNDHARIPSFPLHERVFPIIAPYAFQTVSLPDEYIKDWASFQKGKPLGIREYWNITQWSVDVPQFNLYSMPKKMKFWADQGVTSLYIESTWAKGPMGHAWWLFAHYAWDTKQDFDQLFDDFLANCFGPGAPDVKKMYDRWSKKYQNEMEAGLSLSDLKNARSKTNDKAIQARIDELMGYVVYLNKYYNYLSSKTTKSYNDLMSYLVDIHPYGLLQTDALIRRYIPKPKGQKTTNLPQRKTIKSLDSWVTDNTKEVKNVDYAISTYQVDYSKLVPCSDAKETIAKNINRENIYQFYLPSNSEIAFEFGTTSKTTTAIFLDENQSIVYQQEVPVGKRYEFTTKATIKLKKGLYTLRYGTLYQFSTVKFPRDIVFTSGNNHYDNYQYPVHYIYIPNDVNEIIYRDEVGFRPGKKSFWRDGAGERHDPIEIAPNIFKVSVPNGQKGKVWRIELTHTLWKVLNIPNVLSLGCFDILD